MLQRASEPPPSPENRRSQNPPRPAMPGDVVSERFVLEFVLGRGAMGEVWAATHKLLGLPCAIKFLAVDPRFDTLDFDERFEVEAKTTARLSMKSRHIVRVTDYGHHDGKPFLVMERLEGETLEERVDRDGPLEVRPAIKIAEQIANALRVAHAEKLVHRDLKSANVFLAKDEQGVPVVKVLDFGLVRVLEAAEPAVRTSIGLIVGSPHSMSPEQAAGKPIDSRSDVWALATVVYEMLTGQSAFQGAQVLELVSNVVRCEYVPIETRAPHHVAFAPVFEKAFRAKIDDRYATVDELVVALRQAAGRTSTPFHEVPAVTAPEIEIDAEELRAATEALAATPTPTSGVARDVDELSDTVAAPSGSFPTAIPPAKKAKESVSDPVELAFADEDEVRPSFAPRRRRWLPAMVVLAGALAVGVLAARKSGLMDRAYAETRGLVEPMKVGASPDPGPLVTPPASAAAPLVTNVPGPTPLVAPTPVASTPLVAPMPSSTPLAPSTAKAAGPVRVQKPAPKPAPPPTTAIPPKVVSSAATPVEAVPGEVPGANTSVPTATEVPPHAVPAPSGTVAPGASAAPAPSAAPSPAPALPSPSPGGPNPNDPASLM